MQLDAVQKQRRKRISANRNDQPAARTQANLNQASQSRRRLAAEVPFDTGIQSCWRAMAKRRVETSTAWATGEDRLWPSCACRA